MNKRAPVVEVRKPHIDMRMAAKLINKDKPILNLMVLTVALDRRLR